MPVELGVWRIDGELEKMDFSALDQEKRLEEILVHRDFEEVEAQLNG